MTSKPFSSRAAKALPASHELMSLKIEPPGRLSIREWPVAERPREKCQREGAGRLSDAELLAIFFRTGTPGMSAVDLARYALKRFGSLRKLLDASLGDFTAIRGLGESKHTQLKALIELGRRYLDDDGFKPQSLDASEKVKRYCALALADKPNEVFAALFLDTQYQLLRFEELFTGTVDSAAVYPREVVKKALQYNAAAVVFSHNHPSGLAEPSQADIDITDKLKRALSLVDIRIVDHIIVGRTEQVSMAERGLL